eukprot:gene12847-17221_t
MGTSASIHSTRSNFFGYQVVKFEYDLITNLTDSLKINYSKDILEISNPNEVDVDNKDDLGLIIAFQSIVKDDLQLINHLTNTYNSAIEYFITTTTNIEEGSTKYNSLEHCKVPIILVYLYEKLTAEEKHEYSLSMIENIIVNNNLNKKQIKNSKANDYDSSFGGTEADSKNEKEAAILLRGDNNNTDDNNNLYGLIKPTINNYYEKIILKKYSKWFKFFNAWNDCFLYFNNLTFDIVSLRPQEYEDEIDTALINNSSQNELIDKSNGVKTVSITTLIQEIESIINEKNKTPLIIDTSPSHVVRTFFSYKAHLEDVSSLTVPFGVSGVKREDIMEKCRSRLVGAMKSGSLFVLYLGEVSIEHADFKTKLCKKNVFPKETFIESGRKLLQPEYDPRYKHIYKEPDLESGQAIVRDGFKVIVVTSIDPYKYQEALEDCIPLGYMEPLYIDSDS